MRNAWLRRLLIVTHMQGSYSPCPLLKSYKNSLRTQQCIGGRLATKKLIDQLQGRPATNPPTLALSVTALTVYFVGRLSIVSVLVLLDNDRF